MSMTTSSLNFLIDEVTSSLAYTSYYEKPFMYPVLFDVRLSERNRERSSSTNGLTLWEAKNEGQKAATDKLTQQFQRDFIHTSYGKTVPVARELADDNEFDLIGELGEELGGTARQSQERDAALLWDGFFTSSNAIDGLSVVNGAHLNADGGNSQSNSGTNALANAGLEASRLAMRGFTNARGDKMSVRPDMLVVPPALEQTAWELVNSTLKPGTDQNNANFYDGSLDLIVWDFLASSTKWYMVARDMMARNLLWHQRTAMEIYGFGDFDAQTRQLGGFMRYSLGVREWHWIYGNNPS